MIGTCDILKDGLPLETRHFTLKLGRERRVLVRAQMRQPDRMWINGCRGIVGGQQLYVLAMQNGPTPDFKRTFVPLNRRAVHLKTAEQAAETFEGDLELSYHLAPPLFSRMGPNGRPKKRAFGPWVLTAFKLLARAKGLRGTPLDIFGYSAERRSERRLITLYRDDMELIAQNPDHPAARALAKWPQEVRGFGPVKEAAMKTALERRDELRASFGQAPHTIAAE